MPRNTPGGASRGRACKDGLRWVESPWLRLLIIGALTGLLVHPPPQPHQSFAAAEPCPPRQCHFFRGSVIYAVFTKLEFTHLKRKEMCAHECLNCVHLQASPATSLAPRPCSSWAPASGRCLSPPHCYPQGLALLEDGPKSSLALFFIYPLPAFWSHSLGVVTQCPDCPLPTSETPGPGSKIIPLLSLPLNPATSQGNPCLDPRYSRSFSTCRSREASSCSV